MCWRFHSVLRPRSNRQNPTTHTWNHKYTHTKRTTSSGLGRCPGPGGAGGRGGHHGKHRGTLSLSGSIRCGVPSRGVIRGASWVSQGGHGVSDGVSEIFHRSVRSFFFWAPRAPRHPSCPPPRFQWSTRPHASSQVAEARAWRSLTTSGLKPLREGRRRSDLGPRYRATWSSLGFLLSLACLDLGLVTGWDEMASRVYSDATTPNVFFGLGTYQIPQRRPEAQKDSACRQGPGKLATRKQLEAEGKAPERRTPLLTGLAEFPVAFRSPDTRDRGSISRIRDLDSELQRPSSPSPSSYTTSSHPPRGCFRKIWTTGCSRCMQQHISLSTSTRIA